MLLWLMHGWYALMPGVVVFIAGTLTLGVWRVWFESGPRKKYIPKGLVTFEPVRREFRRYGSAEMCGPLPNTLYKVLPQQYACRLLDDGEMMWSALTYFQHELDPTRGDPFEGSLRYFPAEGLKVTRTERRWCMNRCKRSTLAAGVGSSPS